MNKKLVAAALGLAFAAPVFADSSNVTLYGRIHQTLDHQSGETRTGGVTNQAGGSFVVEDASSRLGVRGVEDLGGGLSAIFAYEFGVTTDEVSDNAVNNNIANGPMTTRHAYLGLKGSYGLFVIGSQDGGNSFGYAGNFGGVQINARHSMQGDNDQSNNTATLVKENDFRATEITATYKVGALTVGGGFANFDQQELNNPLGNGDIERTIQGVASYNFGAFTVAGLVAQNSYEAQNAANGEDSGIEYALSATMPLTANSGLFGMYGSSERYDLNTEARENTQAQIAYYYDFSKRTRTYVGFNRVESEVEASTVGTAGNKTERDNFTIGLRHNF
eukprot:gene11423-biopygen9959